MRSINIQLPDPVYMSEDINLGELFSLLCEKTKSESVTLYSGDSIALDFDLKTLEYQFYPIKKVEQAQRKINIYLKYLLNTAEDLDDFFKKLEEYIEILTSKKSSEDLIKKTNATLQLAQKLSGIELDISDRVSVGDIWYVKFINAFNYDPEADRAVIPLTLVKVIDIQDNMVLLSFNYSNKMSITCPSDIANLKLEAPQPFCLEDLRFIQKVKDFPLKAV